MTKTALDLDDNEDEPVTGMTSEDIARSLLDALVVSPPKSVLELDVKIRVATAYIELSKAYIIADAIRDATRTLTDRKAPNND